MGRPPPLKLLQNSSSIPLPERHQTSRQICSWSIYENDPSPTLFNMSCHHTRACLRQLDVSNNNSSTTMYDDTQAIWMLMNGSAKADASLLNNSTLAPYAPYPPPNGAASVTKTFNINQTDPVVWAVDEAPYAEATTPVIYGRISDGWNAGTTLHMPSNATVDIIMQVSDQSTDSVSTACVHCRPPTLVAYVADSGTHSRWVMRRICIARSSESWELETVNTRTRHRSLSLYGCSR